MKTRAREELSTDPSMFMPSYIAQLCAHSYFIVKLLLSEYKSAIYSISSLLGSCKEMQLQCIIICGYVVDSLGVGY